MGKETNNDNKREQRGNTNNLEGYVLQLWEHTHINNREGYFFRGCLLNTHK